MSNLYSLHIGVEMTNFKETSISENFRMNGARSVVKLMKEISSKHGFVPTPLVDENASISNVLHQLLWYKNNLNPGDFLFLSFVGHGFHENTRANNEPDKKNELLGLYDYTLRDDYLTQFLRSLKEGVNVVTFFDSCYSGGYIDEKFLREAWRNDVSTEVLDMIDADRKEMNCSIISFVATDEGGEIEANVKDPYYSVSMIVYLNQLPDSTTYLELSQKLKAGHPSSYLDTSIGKNNQHIVHSQLLSPISKTFNNNHIALKNRTMNAEFDATNKTVHLTGLGAKYEITCNEVLEAHHTKFGFHIHFIKLVQTGLTEEDINIPTNAIFESGSYPDCSTDNSGHCMSETHFIIVRSSLLSEDKKDRIKSKRRVRYGGGGSMDNPTLSK